MRYKVLFERYDFTKKPVVTQRKYIVIRFEKLTDENLERFERLMWKTLFLKRGTGVRGNYSSWLEQGYTIL